MKEMGLFAISERDLLLVELVVAESRERSGAWVEDSLGYGGARAHWDGGP